MGGVLLACCNRRDTCTDSPRPHRPTPARYAPTRQAHTHTHTHAPSTDTIMDCDQLLVLSAGRLLEQGAPGGLLGCEGGGACERLQLFLLSAYVLMPTCALLVDLFLTLQASWRSLAACLHAWWPPRAAAALPDASRQRPVGGRSERLSASLPPDAPRFSFQERAIFSIRSHLPSQFISSFQEIAAHVAMRRR